MAFERVASLSYDETIDVCSTHDKAIDGEHPECDVDAYATSLNMRTLKFKSGQRPSILKIRILRPKELQRVENAGWGAVSDSTQDLTMDALNEAALMVYATAQLGEAFDIAAEGPDKQYFPSRAIKQIATWILKLTRGTLAVERASDVGK